MNEKQEQEAMNALLLFGAFLYMFSSYLGWVTGQ